MIAQTTETINTSAGPLPVRIYHPNDLIIVEGPESPKLSATAIAAAFCAKLSTPRLTAADLPEHLGEYVELTDAERAEIARVSKMARPDVDTQASCEYCHGRGKFAPFDGKRYASEDDYQDAFEACIECDGRGVIDGALPQGRKQYFMLRRGETDFVVDRHFRLEVEVAAGTGDDMAWFNDNPREAEILYDLRGLEGKSSSPVNSSPPHDDRRACRCRQDFRRAFSRSQSGGALMATPVDGTFAYAGVGESAQFFGYFKPGSVMPDYSLRIDHGAIYTCDCPSAANSASGECKHTRALAEWIKSHPAYAQPLVAAPVEAPAYVAKDGYAVDPDTGEVYGMVDDDGKLLPEKHERFAVRTTEDAEWVLSLLLDQESQIAGLKAKRDAICANIDAQIKQHESRVNWVKRRFEADLRFWAGEKLKGLKQKSVQLVHGTLAFRRTAGSIKPIDLTSALEWARIHAPEAIQVKESLTVTPLKGQEEALPRDIFEVTEASDSFSVKTNLKGVE